MQIVDIFSGVGGFSLAGKWMGWKTVQFCEIGEFCQTALKYYFPDVPIHSDIKTLTGEKIINNGRYKKGYPTIIVGGPPCQPWSIAGKRKGSEDDRNLWYEAIRLVKELKPDFVLFENVSGIISSNGGLVFEQVHTDLEDEGYEVQAFVLPAAGVEAPHQRDRVWFIAYNNYRDGEKVGFRPGREEHVDSTERKEFPSDTESIRREWHGHPWRRRKRFSNNDKRTSRDRNAAYAKAIRMEGYGAIGQQEPGASIKNGISGRNHARTDWSKWPTQSPLCSRNDDIFTRLVGITFSKHRNESIKAYGNAVAPELVYEIFKVIDKMNNL